MAKTARSQRYKGLEKELALLRHQLLPSTFNPIGVYKDKVLTKTAAYRILVHAEIEEFLEERVWDIANASINSLETANRINRVIACLLAFCGKKLDCPPDTLAPPPDIKPTDWKTRLELVEKAKFALNAFYHSVEQNHGIREKDVLGLLMPVGIQPSQLDSAWLSTIDTFGQRRGAVAHHSASNYRTQILLDPKTEYNNVKTILKGLREIDDFLNKLEN